MENQNIQTSAEQSQPTPPPIKPHNPLNWLKFSIGTVTLLFIVALIGVGNYLLGSNQNSTKITSQTSEANPNDFFFFSIPKPIKNLAITDLPNDGNPNNVVRIGDSLWFAGDGSIVEYDIKSGAIVSYSDQKKANCDRDLVYVAGYLFASCHIDNVFDAFERTSQLQTELYTGHYGVLKINPQTHKLEHIFSKEDGLLNGYNYQLTADGDTIWIATFNGLGRINARTNHVDFYTDDLGFQNSSNAVSFGIVHIIVDKDYVWAWAGANAESQGGVALFNKALGTWKAFGPRELMDYTFDRIDLEYDSNRYAAKLIPGGIQIAFRDGNLGTQNRLVEKQYIYQSGKWTKVNGDRIATGPDSEQKRQYIASTYPSSFNYQKVDQSGLTQLQLPDSNQVYQLDGRNNYALSPMMGNKRYILTSATVDVIDDSSPFGKILVKLGERIGIMGPPDQVQFLVNSNTSLALVIDPACGMGCSEKAWLIDLKAKKINKIYTTKDGLPEGELLRELSMDKQGNILVINDKNGKELFNIDIINFNLTVPAKAKITVSGQVYRDDNCNMAKDTGEQGLANVQVAVFKISDYTSLANLLTDSNGIYTYSADISSTESVTLRPIATAVQGYQDNPKFRPAYGITTLSMTNPSATVNLYLLPTSGIKNCR